MYKLHQSASLLYKCVSLLFTTSKHRMRTKYSPISLLNILFFIAVFSALCVTLLTILNDHDRHNLFNNFNKGNLFNRQQFNKKSYSISELNRHHYLIDSKKFQHSEWKRIKMFGSKKSVEFKAMEMCPLVSPMTGMNIHVLPQIVLQTSTLKINYFRVWNGSPLLKNFKSILLDCPIFFLPNLI
jgi:hypothetical protein